MSNSEPNNKSTTTKKPAALVKYFGTFRNLFIFAETYYASGKVLEEENPGFKEKMKTKAIRKTAKASMKPEMGAVSIAINKGEIEKPVKVLFEKAAALSTQLDKKGIQVPVDDTLLNWITVDTDFNERHAVKEQFLKSVSDKEIDELDDETKKLVSRMAFNLCALFTSTKLLDASSTTEVQSILTGDLSQVVLFGTYYKWYGKEAEEAMRERAYSLNH